MSTATTQQPPATPAAAAPPNPAKQLTVPEKQRLTLRRLFDQQKPELALLMPAGMSADRIFRMALTECVKNPKLLECTAESWALALQKCAAQGLYPDSELGYMYLIPRNNSKRVGEKWVKVMEVTAQRGYQGDIKLARNSGEIEDIYPEVVYEKDEYKVVKGLDRNLIHVPYAGDDDPGPLKACYAVAKLKNGEVAWRALSRRDVMRHKESAQGTEREDSPWRKHEAAMWMKTAIHELYKWLPKSSDQADNVARTLASDGDGRVTDVTAIDMGRVELPAAGETGKGGLDALTDRLAAAADAGNPPQNGSAPADESDGPVDCKSKCESVPRNIPPGKVIVCVDCGSEYEGEPLPPPDPAAPEPPAVDAIKAVAAVAGAQGARRPAGFTQATEPRQSRMKE